MIVLYSVAGLVTAMVLAMLLLGRTGPLIPTGRLGRAARLSRLVAGLSTSWLGAKVRRAFTSKSKRTAYDERRRAADAEALVKTMGQMKGAMMKVGQMMSFISDDVPVEYRAALKSLQASAPPMDFALLRDVAERELGKPLERAFARFDEVALASASIGQVHRAQLPSGDEVVVKIQYPGVAQAIAADMNNVALMYGMVGLMYPGLDPKPVVAELRGRFIEELDYRREAKNQRVFCDLYDGHPFIRVPRIHASHCTAHVLTSEFVAGRPFEDVRGGDEAERNRIAEILWRFVFQSIVRFGVFNGDPHPGNYLFGDDGRVTFLDYGCVKYFPEDMITGWMGLVRRHLERRRDDFRAQASELGFFAVDAPLSADLIFDYFAYFYAPISEDAEFRFSTEYNAKSLGMVFKPTGQFAGLTKKINMPPDFVFVNRLQWGVYSLMAQLGARGNWHRIQREYLFGDAPATELGASERRFRASWLATRGLPADQLLLVDHDGVRARRPIA
jgi:predicted unusual protein kinase regulating ubiquinone biosynthesis (AarF/ABC1/UbiB family)